MNKKTCENCHYNMHGLLCYVDPEPKDFRVMRTRRDIGAVGCRFWTKKAVAPNPIPPEFLK